MKWNRNPNAGKFVLPEGFKDIGWQLRGNEPELVECRSKSHKTREFDNSQFQYRCTDVVTICDECKYVYHTDMSD